MTPVIALHEVRRAYTNERAAVDGVSFNVVRGELLALLGPSGCGKTTTLRLIAGLEKPDAGEIRLAGRQVAGNGVWTPPETRQVGFVFQDYALFPHLTVAGNLAFPLARLPRVDRRERIGELLALTGLEGLELRYPHQLSGGQQQRVALARALASHPTLLLLDEPFSNLDAALRTEMREELRRIVRAASTTTVFVTHDQEEALSLADTVAVMFDGRLVQLGTPREIYTCPATRQAATFVGDANWLAGEGQGREAICALGRVELYAPAYGPLDLLIRPEALLIEPDALGSVRVERVVFYGHDQLVHITLPDGTALKTRARPNAAFAPGDHVCTRILDPVVTFPSTIQEIRRYAKEVPT